MTFEFCISNTLQSAPIHATNACFVFNNASIAMVCCTFPNVTLISHYSMVTLVQTMSSLLPTISYHILATNLLTTTP